MAKTRSNRFLGDDDQAESHVNQSQQNLQLGQDATTHAAGPSHGQVLGATTGIPPLPHRQTVPIAPTAEGQNALLQRQEALEDTVRQLTEAVNMLVQAQVQNVPRVEVQAPRHVP